jgi:hypothetical protein
MKGLQKLENVFHKLFSKRSKPAYSRDTIADWQRILGVFFVGLLIVVGINTYFFMKLNRGEIFNQGKTEPGTSEIINRKELSDINAYYDAKAIKADSITASTTVPIDPSR